MVSELSQKYRECIWDYIEQFSNPATRSSALSHPIHELDQIQKEEKKSGETQDIINRKKMSIQQYYISCKMGSSSMPHSLVPITKYEQNFVSSFPVATEYQEVPGAHAFGASKKSAPRVEVAKPKWEPNQDMKHTNSEKLLNDVLREAGFK